MKPSVLQIVCRLPANNKCFDFIIKFNFFLKSDFKTRNGSKRARDCLGIENIYIKSVCYMNKKVLFFTALILYTGKIYVCIAEFNWLSC